MKIKITIVITLIAIIVSGAFGLKCRQTFTEYNNLEDYYVGELPGEMVKNIVKKQTKKIKKSKYILKVVPLKSAEFIQNGLQQQVKVTKVFSGDNVKVGDIFYAVMSYTSLNTSEPRDVNMNFVNELKENQEYLTFFDKRLEIKNELYFVTPETMLPPFYSYISRDNVIVPIADDAENTYVEYKLVKDNEFFVTTEEGLERLNALKKELTELYN